MTKNNYISIIIIAILVAIIFLQTCNKKHIPNINAPLVETKISYIHDTIKLENTVYKPKYIPRIIHDTIYDSIGNIISIVDNKKYITFDTFSYLSDSINFKMFTKIVGDCPLDSIKNNFIFNIRHKIIKETITKKIEKNNTFFMGPSGGAGKNNGYISMDLLYSRKNQTIYQIGGGINNQGQYLLKAGIYWKLNK